MFHTLLITIRVTSTDILWTHKCVNEMGDGSVGQFLKISFDDINLLKLSCVNCILSLIAIVISVDICLAQSF